LRLPPDAATAPGRPQGWGDRKGRPYTCYTTHMSIERLPLTYRAELLRDIYRHLAAGKCGALIGVASSGKSRLVEFLGRPDVRQHYLGDGWTNTLFPWVDGNDLLERSEWGLYEKVLSAILTDLDCLPDRGGEARAKVEAWYWKLVAPENRPLARRFVALAIADLGEAVSRVVLLLDDFESFIAAADDDTLSGLRSLRDRFKNDNEYRLLYLAASRRQLVSLKETATPGFESFLELFKNFTVPIGCYDEDDALHMIQRLSEAYPLARRTLTPDLAKRLVMATGGHAGLIDAAFHSKTEAEWNRPDLGEVLIASGGVWNECVSIWESLDDEDHSALMAIVRGGDPGAAATHWLERSGIVKRDQIPQVFEVFRLFLADMVKHGPEVKIDPDRRALSVDGCSVELVERELTLVNHLFANRGKLCEYAELYQRLYPNGAALSNAQSEVQAIVRRVQSKLNRACGARPILIHYPDRGYRMIGADGK